MNAISLSQLPPGGAATFNSPVRPQNETQRRLWESAKSLESVFSGYLLENMKSKLPGTSSAPGNAVFADMFAESISKSLADSERLGLAKIIYKQTVAQADKPSQGVNSTR